MFTTMGNDIDYCRFSDYYKVAERFGVIFGVRLTNFVDNMQSALIYGHVVIDLIKFDEWLHKKHGDYESQGLSIKSCIEKYYGKEGEKIISMLI